MPLDAVQYHLQIIDEVGDTPNGLLATNMERYWDSGEAEATIGLRFLYVKMRCIRAVLASERRTAVDSQGLGTVSAKLHQRIDTLVKMLEDTRAEYKRCLDVLTGGYGGAVGQLETTAPIAAPTGFPDANDPGYRGDPYRRSR